MRARAGGDPPRLRRDIQGLRAVAILAVVGYHAAVPGMGGGYAGVDVFFVISGFLITDLLHADLREHARVRFATFYGRRARRLLPSAVLVILATVAASSALLSPLRAAAVLRDAVASALYVANYRFAVAATSYLNAGHAPSPLLHYWSLGVEEQFYLVWPALLTLAVVAWRRRRARAAGGPDGPRPSTRAPAMAALATVLVASFGASLWLTHANEPWAFFSLPTRAWELAAGGLLALGRPTLQRMPRSIAAAVGWCGLGVVVWSVVAFTASTPFPGTAALAPVGGAAAILAAGCVRRAAGPQLLLDLAPFQGVGKVSYTWYLWHWPVLVLAPAVVGRPLGLPGRGVAVAIGLALAVGTTVAVEDPLRRAGWLGRPRRGLALAGVASALAVAATAGAAAALPPAVGSGHVRHEALAVRHAATASGVAGTGSGSGVAGTGGGGGGVGAGGGPGPTSTTPLGAAEATAASLTAEVQSAVTRGVTVQQVPLNVQPPLTRAAADEATPFVDGCFDGFVTTSVNPCSYGDTSSAKTMVLFGDSHALMWFPALDNIANQQQWHLVAAAKATCPPLDLRIFSPDLDEWYTQCTTWRQAVVARIRALRPAVVVLGFSREYGITNDHVVVDGPAWMAGLAKMIATLEATGARVVVMGDVPYPDQVVADCLATHLSDATACDVPRAAPHLNVPGIAQERRVVTADGAGYVDTEPWFCTSTVCADLVQGMVVYRDTNHITATYATWLTPVIQADLAVATDLRVLPPSGTTGPATGAGTRLRSG